MAERWLFPLGHYLGPFFPGQGADLDGHRVRVGQEVVTLFGDTEFTVWALAHGVPGSSGVRGTRHAVEAALREQTGADAGAAVDELLRDGVLLEVGDGANDPVEFARRYRFRWTNSGPSRFLQLYLTDLNSPSSPQPDPPRVPSCEPTPTSESRS